MRIKLLATLPLLLPLIIQPPPPSVTNTVAPFLVEKKQKTPRPPQFDALSNYQTTVVTPCETAGGHMDKYSCVIPPPPPPPAIEAPTPVYSDNIGGILARIKMCESSGNYGNNDTGHNGHYGAYQFDFGTWASVGGSGNPASASPSEQDMRAQLLYNQRGTSPWLASIGCWG